MSNTATASVNVRVIDPPAYVDLGLPSGNMWASRNWEATKPSDMGMFYQWGQEERNYIRENYNENCQQFIGTVPVVSLSQYWGQRSNYIQVPSRADFVELLDKCTESIATRAGTQGLLLTSKINGNHIFLPFGDNEMLTTHGEEPFECCYWTCDIDSSNPNYAYVQVLAFNNSITPTFHCNSATHIRMIKR